MEVTASLTMEAQETLWAPNKRVQRAGREGKLEIGINYRAIPRTSSVHCCTLILGAGS